MPGRGIVTDKTNADAPDDIRRAASGASENAARAAAARDAEARRNCCRFPAAQTPPAASDRARDIPDSGIARSSRAGIASLFRLARSRDEPAAQKLRPSPQSKSRESNRPVKPTGLCAGPSSVSREIDTITSGMLSRPRGGNPAGTFREAMSYFEFSFSAEFNCAWRSSIFFCASAISCCLAPI